MFSRLFLFLSISSLYIYSEVVDLSQDWEYNSNFTLSDTLESVIENQIAVLPNTLGFIIIHKGKIVSENYYNSNVNNSINIWSVTKSYISTLVGQAIDMGMLNDPDSIASSFFPINDISYTDSIKLHHILSMSTGYVDQYIPTDPFTFFFDPNQWWALNSTETLLNMNHSTPGTFYYNNSACHLNAHALYYGSGMTPSEFADSYLFPHLGIYNPTWEAGYLEINDGSAMLHLTLREMVKLGQLYIQNGFSGNNQILSSEWIYKSTKSQISTGAEDEYGSLDHYGYLWWLIDEEGSVYTAQGLGGQIIAVFPDYDLVIGAQSNTYGDNIFEHSTALNYKIIDQIAPIFQDYASYTDADYSPNKYILHQNFPNPFNPTTHITYELSKTSLVKITIYDLLGNKVKQLVNDRQTSGNKSIIWNAKNENNEKVSAGVYIYSIETSGFKSSKKMLLLK